LTALIAIGLVAPGLAMAATRYVDDGGADAVPAAVPGDPDTPNDCQVATAPCKTIAQAIGQFASADEIHVGGGSYPESVSLAQGETLVNEAFDSGAGGADTSGAAVLSGDPLDVACAAPTISATSAATVAGLTIESQAGCVDLELGSGAGGAVVRDNRFDDATKLSATTPDLAVGEGSGATAISGNTFSDASPADDQLAIAVHGSSAPSLDASSGAGNDFSGFATAIAIGFAGEAVISTPTIADAHISGLHAYGGGQEGVGVEIDYGANVVLRHNLIDGPGAAPTIGVRLRNSGAGTPAATAVAFERNQIVDETTGISDTDGGLVTLLQDGVRAAGGGALVSVDTTPVDPGSEGEGDVGATNADLIDSTGVAAVSLSDTHLMLDSTIVGDSGSGDGGISASPGASCTIVFSRGPAGGSGVCGTFQSNGPVIFDDTLESPGPFAIDDGSTGVVNQANPNPSPSFPLTDLYGRSRFWPNGCNSDGRNDIGAAELHTLTLTPCPPPTNALTSADFNPKSVFEILSIRSVRRIGNYKLCVDGPKAKSCKVFRATKSSIGFWTDKVNWSQKFPYRGPGRYRVRWSVGNHPIGLGQTFTWGPCAPGNMTLKGVWKPSRLIVIDRCRTIHGKPHTISHSHQDGDFHISFRHEEKGAAGVLEIIPRDQPRHIPPPRSGRRYAISGAFICDTFHGPFGHTEIHPVFQTELLGPHDRVISRHSGGPQFPGTPSVNLNQAGHFHCPGAG
jgi:hypothetical protein